MEPVIDCCDAGLSRIAVPIISKKTVIGQITACGSALHKDEIDTFYIAQQLDVNEDEILQIAATTPVISKERIEELTDRISSSINLNYN